MIRKAILVLTLTLAACNPSKSVVSGCGDSSVLDTVIDGTLAKWAEKAEKLIDEVKSGEMRMDGSTGETPEQKQQVKSQLISWQAKLGNIRQTKYDQDNDVRWCMAEFVYTNYPTEVIATIRKMVAQLLMPRIFMGQMRDNGSQPYASRDFLPDICVKTVEYKIEKLIDQPGEHYVSWICRPRVFDF